jgi:hypothetical protein
VTVVVLPSLSAAMDGGFVAIADVSEAMREAGAGDDHRLIGGVTVMLHVQRLGLDLPLRATGDADFGVPPFVLRDTGLVAAIERRDYRKVAGNRWERPIDDRRVATVDLLVPAHTSRARHTVTIGDVVTTEVPGLALALRRPPVVIDAEFRLTDGVTVTTRVALPDAIGTLALKAGVRTVRSEVRDAQDLWRCLEIAAADGVVPGDFESEAALEALREVLHREVGPDGHALSAIIADMSDDAAVRLRTRLRGLLAEIVGTGEDFLDEMVRERTEANADFPRLFDAARDEQNPTG